MILKPGDRVKFLNDVGGGEVTALMDKTKVMVRTNDGFEFPVLISELVRDTGNFMPEKREREEEEMPVQKPQSKNPPKRKTPEIVEKEESKDEELCFAIVPKPQSSELHAYMINNTSYEIHYVITKHVDEAMLFDQGSMESRTQMKVQKFLPENLNNSIRFNIQVLFYKEGFFQTREPISFSVSISPSEIYSGKALSENDYFDKRAAVFSVVNFNKKNSFSNSISSDLTVLLKEKFEGVKPEPASREIKKSKNEPEEVDLHIEAISDSFSGLSNSEIIDLQMARFKVSLDTAVIHKTKRIVFIHGVGNGKLKYSLRKALDEKYPDLQYQDASFKEYGYGATMVIIP